MFLHPSVEESVMAGRPWLPAKARFLVVTWLALAAPPAGAQAGSPAGAVPAPILEARRQALLARLGNGIAVLRSAPEPDWEADGDHPQDGGLRQDNDFFYLTGLEQSRAWLVLIADSAEDRTILYLPPADPYRARVMGPQLGPGPEAEALTGISTIRPATVAEDDIAELVARHRRLWLKLLPKLQTDPVIQRLMFESGATAIEDLRPLLAAARLVKDPDELTRVRRAIEITTEGIREAMRTVTPGVWEYEIEASMEAVFRRRGAERLGFPSIVASGPNATVLHYDASRRRTQSGDLVVTDVGAEFGYYTADVTRTWPVSGKFTARQRALYELVLATQQVGMDSVRPGMTLGRLHRIAQSYLRLHSGTLCAPKSCDEFFIHGLSHFLGMDVHDVGDPGTPLAPGMILTVEPGVYLPEEGIGIRIEDDVLVTADGHELLSGGAPRTITEIEKLMGERTRTQGRKP
jgi:Xaa-Pro aminopeptidase